MLNITLPAVAPSSSTSSALLVLEADCGHPLSTITKGAGPLNSLWRGFLCLGPLSLAPFSLSAVVVLIIFRMARCKTYKH